ncbi:MAG: TonB-dependent SusC/RagA subfamily outer membrane receptor [Parvicella sp.]|jgi:TonB-dependent SusC/RagA subfamily outer membrane receptor
MNGLTAYISEGVIHALGMTFLHSIWLGVLAAFFVSIAFHVFKEKRANIRYNISASAMAVFFLAVCCTFIIYYEDTSNYTLPSIDYEDRLSETEKIVSNGITTAEIDLLDQVHDFLNLHEEALVVFWLIGIVLLSIRFAGGFIYIRKLRTSGLGSVPEEWELKMEEWGAKLGIKKLPSFHTSLLVTSPIAFGYLKPMILFPLGMFTSMPVQHLDAMLMHELIHVKNADYITNLFLSVVEILLFFNPVVWWLSGLIRAEMEHRCDDMAVVMTGNKTNYAYALVAMQENKIFQKSELALGMAKSNSQLTQRVNRLFGSNGGKTISYGRPLISFVVLVASVLLLAFSSPEEKSSYTEPELNFVEGTHSVPLKPRVFTLTKKRNPAWSGTVRILLIDGSEVPTSQLDQLNDEEIESIEVYTGSESDALDVKYEGQPVLVVRTRKGGGSIVKEDSIRNAFYYFNNKPVDKDTFYQVQVSEDSLGASHGLILEDRFELRFYTDMQMYEAWKKKMKQDMLDDKFKIDKPVMESILLVDGKEMPMEYLEKLNEEKNIGWIGVNTGTHAEAISEEYKGKSVTVVKTKRSSLSNLIEKEIIEGVIGDSIKYKYYPKSRILKTADRSYKVKTTVVPEGENWKDLLKLEVDTYERQKINNFRGSSKPVMSKYNMLVARSMAKRHKVNFGYDPRTRVGFGPSLTKSIGDSTELINRIKEKPGLTLINKIPHGVNQNGYSAFDTIKAIGGSGFIPGARIVFSTGLSKSIDQDSIPPLIIVDGVKVKSISTLDPRAIESISVLKDKSATEVYGEEGDNGVILITSKNIKESKRINDTKHIMDNKLQVNHRIVKRDNKFYLQGKVTGNITKENVTDAFIRFDDNWQETFHTDENGEFEMEVPSGAKEIVIRHFMLPSVYIPVDRQKMGKEIFVSDLKKTLKVYPNPTIDHFIRIELENEKKQWVVLKVFSVADKKMVRTITRKTLKPGSYEFSLDSRKLDPGTYVLVVLKGTDKIERNFVVSH